MTSVILDDEAQFANARGVYRTAAACMSSSAATRACYVALGRRNEAALGEFSRCIETERRETLVREVVRCGWQEGALALLDAATAPVAAAAAQPCALQHTEPNAAQLAASLKEPAAAAFIRELYAPPVPEDMDCTASDTEDDEEARTQVVRRPLPAKRARKRPARGEDHEIGGGVAEGVRRDKVATQLRNAFVRDSAAHMGWTVACRDVSRYLRGERLPYDDAACRSIVQYALGAVPYAARARGESIALRKRSDMYFPLYEAAVEAAPAAVAENQT